MITVSLNYCVDFGAGEYSDWCEYEIELAGEEEAAYLAALSREDCGLNDCEELEPILLRAADEIRELAKEDLEEGLGEDAPEDGTWSVVVEFAEDQTEGDL